MNIRFIYYSMVVYILLVLILCTSCGQQTQISPRGRSGVNCYDSTGDSNKDGKLGPEDCKGDPGYDGEKGDTGPAGAPGSRGPKGDTGPAGRDGKDTPVALLYVGSYCGRIVIKAGDTFYISNTNLIPLTTTFLVITTGTPGCKVRVENNIVITEP